MPRGGIKKNKTTSVAVQEGCRSVPRGVPFPLFTCAISSFFAPKPHGNACYAGYGGPREQYRSVPRDGVKKRGERSVADRESSIALCHGMALKKKGSVEDRESSITLCHGMALKKKGSAVDRESGVALCNKVALKKKGERERYRSRTERAVSLSATGWR